MPVSITQYRSAIGLFDNNKLNRGKVKYKKKFYHSNSQMSTINLFVSVLLLLSQTYDGHHLPGAARQGVHGEQGWGQGIEKWSFSKTRIISQSESVDYETNYGPQYISWPCLGNTANKLQKIINGNRRSLGYKLGLWNCGRGLLNATGGTSKFSDVKLLIQNKKPHALGLIETDIFGPNSNNNSKKFTTSEIQDLLKIDGYSIKFPATWDSHGIARVLVYVSNDVKSKQIFLNSNHEDLPSVSLEIGIGRATKTVVHYYYREWTGGVSGEDSKASQLDRNGRHIEQWTELGGRQLQLSF